MNLGKNSFWLRWTVACGLAEFAGIGLAGLIAGLTIRWLGEPDAWSEKILTLSAMLLAGALEGWLVGHFQAKVLRTKLPSLSAAGWIKATVWVAVAGWFAGMLPSTFLTGNSQSGAAAEPPLWMMTLSVVAMGLAAGALFGWAQYRVLRRYVSWARGWIGANALAWGAGLWWVYLGASWPDGSEPLWCLVALGVGSGLLMGLTVGAVTGLFLVRKLGN